MSIPGTGSFVTAYRPPTFTAVATPAKLIAVDYSGEKNGPGAGLVTIPLDDPAYELIRINDVLAIRREGGTVAAVLIERIEEHTLDIDGGARQVAMYKGRTVGAFMEWARIAPALGDRAKPDEDDAIFGFQSPRYNSALDSWVAATELMTVAVAASGTWAHQPMAEEFDLTAGASMLLTSAGDADYAPKGWYLFGRIIDVTTPGWYGSDHLLDDLGKFWVDGIEMLDVRPEDGFVRASHKRFQLSTGWHWLTWAVFNLEDPDNPGFGLGPAALAYHIYKADLQDRPLAGGPQWVSDSDTSVLYVDDDPWPGMTVGEILLDLIGEAQGRGALTWIDPSFTTTHDSKPSSPNTWEREAGITTKTGTTSLLQFLDELTATGRISRWRLRPDGVTLDVFAPGYTSRPGDVELTVVPLIDARTGEVLVLDRVIT